MSKPVTLDLSKEDFDIVDAILRAHVPGRPVFIFGSRVTGSARRRSDLDLAIGGNAPLTLNDRAELRAAFSQSDLPMMVDFIDLADAKGIFRKRIESEWISFEAAAEQFSLKAVA